jgi:hypothetical protein
VTVHLFAGHAESDNVVVVTSGITLCCHVHSSGLSVLDGGTINPDAADCPELDKSKGK